MTALVPVLFLTKKLFRAFRASLKTEVQEILDALIWEEVLSQDKIEEKFNTVIYTTEEIGVRSNYSFERHEIKKPFLFFKVINHNRYGYGRNKPNYSLFILPKLRHHISQFYDPPKGSKIEPVEKLEPTEFIYDTGQQDIFLEIQRIIAYEKQGQIKTSSKLKPQPSTLGKMQRKLNLKEFYPIELVDKPLKTIRTNLIASLMLKNRQQLATLTGTDIFKALFNETYPKYFSSLLGIMTHLKGVGLKHYESAFPVEPTLWDILNELPQDEWVSMENIELMIKYNFINIGLVSNYLAENRLYYEVMSEWKGGKYKEKKYIQIKDYDDAITRPLLKGTFFLFAAFGLVDVAYDTPDIEELSKTAYSYHDGLKYVRLTSLGAHLLGRTSEYEMPSEITDTKIKLSKDSLTIISDKNDPTAAVILEPFTDKVTPNRFRTDFGIFLKSVANKEDLQAKINLFKQSVGQDLPENWNTFFKELEQKIDPIRKVSNVSIFKIPEDNPALINLIAKDDVFKKIVMKAEGYQVLVARRNLTKFKTRLQEYGYLMSK
ncbi:MAG: hypothetical protein AAF573_13030 [Bacteroidota bacterium]